MFFPLLFQILMFFEYFSYWKSLPQVDLLSTAVTINRRKSKLLILWMFMDVRMSWMITTKIIITLTFLQTYPVNIIKIETEIDWL